MAIENSQRRARLACTAAQLPKSLTPQELKRLLAGCDRRTPDGRRDYAMLLLFARLGLRAGQLKTTQIYARVDIKALRGIAPPRIGGAQ